MKIIQIAPVNFRAVAWFIFKDDKPVAFDVALWALVTDDRDRTRIVGMMLVDEGMLVCDEQPGFSRYDYRGGVPC